MKQAQLLRRYVTSTFLLLALPLLIACSNPDNETVPTQTATAPVTPPTATKTLSEATTRPPTAATPTPRNELLQYRSADNLFTITFSREWIFTDFSTLFLATNDNLINSPGFQENDSLIMFLSDLNDEIVRENALAKDTTADLLNSYILSGELNQFGANFRLLDDIEIEQRGPREIARASLSTTSSDGEIGLVFLTAIAENDRRLLVVALTTEGSLGRYANSFETIINSVLLETIPRVEPDERPILTVNTTLSGNWTDGPSAVDIILQANVPVLAVLVTANDSDGVLVLEDSDGIELQQKDVSPIGQPEAMQIEVERGERYTLRIRERTRSLGQYQIILVNLAFPSPTLITSQEEEVVGLGSAKYFFQPKTGSTYLIYVEALGPNVALQDPVITVVDANNNVLAMADNAYLSEPEILILTLPDEMTEITTILISDYFGQSGLYQLHFHELSPEQDTNG